MPDQPIVTGGIIAAGAGSRLRQAGWKEPKPLVRVAGTPLIEQVIRNFLAAGIQSFVVIFNENELDCRQWVMARFPDLDLQIIVKTTASSLESFREVGARMGPGSGLISTVDTWCPEEEVMAFVRAARQYPSDATVLAVTSFVADERPLWVTMDASGRISSLGGNAGNAVTAGMYIVPERVRKLSMPGESGRLRDFLAWLVNQGELVYGVRLGEIVDVDRAEDVALAELMARRARPMSVRLAGEQK